MSGFALHALLRRFDSRSHVTPDYDRDIGRGTALPTFDDCFALNVAALAVWVFGWSEHAVLALLSHGRLSGVWRELPSPGTAVAVGGETAIISVRGAEVVGSTYVPRDDHPIAVHLGSGASERRDTLDEAGARIQAAASAAAPRGRRPAPA